MTTDSCFGEYGQHKECIMSLKGKPYCSVKSSCSSTTSKKRTGNPNGYNKYKVNPDPKEKEMTKIQKFKELSKGEQYSWLQKEGNLLYRDQKKITTRKKHWTNCHKLFFDFKFEDE